MALPSPPVKKPTTPLAVRASDLRTKRETARVFFSMASPRIITAAALLAVVARVALGRWSLGDLVVVTGVLVLTGPLEWVVHTFLLHTSPESFVARRFQAGVSHRLHHLDPPALDHLLLSGPDAAVFTVLLGLAPVVWALPTLAITGLPVAPPLLTAVAATYVGFANYEWTHLLVHTRYRPRSRFYGRLARNHRLHHFRNERHWMGVTSNLGDRALGTLPRHKGDVELSETARSLR